MLRKWEKLPEFMQIEEVRPYYEVLNKKRASLVLKRIFDVMASALMLVLLSPMMLVISILIVNDSMGGVFFRQERVTQYGKVFRIYKFRTMVADAERIGSQVTVSSDPRVTRIGKMLRGCRMDEFPQLINILLGDMSFVGTRPEVVKYVDKYGPEMLATLLLPAGVTSEASIQYKDEAQLMVDAVDADSAYIARILPAKMHFNLNSLRCFSFWQDIVVMYHTVGAMVQSRGT